MEMVKGELAVDMPVRTPDGGIGTLFAQLDSGRTALFFLRDAACVLTQAYLSQLCQNTALFQKHHIQIVAVVNSSPAGARSVLEGIKPPFRVVCDEAGSLYQRYGVGCAASLEALGNEATKRRIRQAYDLGFQHGTDTGEKLRLPACFLLDGDKRIYYAHYGQYGDDLPTAAELEPWMAGGAQ